MIDVGKPPIERDLRRNIASVLSFEFTWGLGLSFALYTTMVPAYLTTLGSPKSLIGFMQSLWTIATPVQLLSGHFFGRRHRVRNIIQFYMAATGIRFLSSAAALFFPGIWTPAALVVFFTLACSGLVGFIVLAQPLYVAILTDNVPLRIRGRLYGARTAALGLGGVLTGILASMILHRVASPRNYQLAFLIGDACFFLSTLSLLPFRDHCEPSAPERVQEFFSALKGKLRRLLDDPNYRLFVFFHILNVAAVNMAGFIVPYAKEALRASDSQVAYLSLIFLGVNAFTGSLLGRLADRFGYRSVATLQSLLLMAFFMIAISARGFLAVCVAYGFLSTVTMSLVMVLTNMSVELCPEMGTTDLVALGTIIVLPFIATIAPLSGTIIDLTGSYLSVFFIGFAVALIALLGFAFLVREPRTGKLFVIKQIPMR